MNLLELFNWLRAKGHTGIFIRWSTGMLEAIGINHWREHGPAVNDNVAKS